MDLSIVIPLYNEEESLPELEAWIRRVVEREQYQYEIIMVDDGSSDTSWSVIEELARNNPNVVGIKFRRNYGKSAALNTGFAAAKGKVVITMDADMQDSPDEIPALQKMISEEGYDLISGWKKERHDPISKTIPSKFFNRITRWISGIELHDFNCGLKAYRHEVIKGIEVYGEMHRYIPLLAKWSGFQKIGEKVVEHRARKYGTTKFGLERFVNGFLDLLSITFVGRFGKRPMHLFGTLGTAIFILGLCSSLYIGVNKLYRLNANLPTILITDNPYFFIALTCMIIGTFLFLTGFLAELVSRNAPDRNLYLIEKKING
ncbi:glycosyltransferase family 2 protein [Flavilitoribacter nigricans]|uniref:Glycosyltransferase n=1 Tax=Flavilitoribacter nigricans (strain ATCC 23147 / DSM 23189 / NBRC 102662 / NCIMB 1420 / SS-2) TaxID=1122177 RepID=A0A2D0N8S4_FLAN2|nr:glycosyltransferase family 2 protein [Flavilitoribacter nigricans]PHN04914.1 glycosyltransferase [Flavilitoribacter nigricans DSM 23189 = NBRC 102662]